MSNPSWTPEQWQCIDSHGGTLLVSAAAGSGKTTVLVERILRRITDETAPLALDRLLVVTFTKAAAAEMRSRLSKALSEKAAERPDDLRLQRQLQLLPRADICTIDSFCANLVRENFHALGISPQFRIADEQQLLLLQRDALQDTLLTFYEEKHPDFLELSAMLTNGKNDGRLLSAVETLYAFIQSYPDPERWLSDTATLYDGNGKVSETVWGKFILEQIVQSLGRCRLLYQAALETAKDDTVLFEKYTPALNEDLALITHLEEAAKSGDWDRLFGGIGEFSQARLSAAKGCTNEEAKARITDLRTEAKSAFKKLAAFECGTEKQCLLDVERSSRLIRMLYDIVRRFSEILTEKKRAANLWDFSDIEHFALQLLTAYDEAGNRVPTPLARELSERLDEILVDEYQDTNAVQDALFVALSRNEQNLFMVGDVKQSIYAFRKAMPELFIGRRNAYPAFDGEQYPATITLGNNFRSRRSVTDAVNFIFRQLMTKEIGGITYDEREELVCSATYPDENDERYDTECLIVDGTQYDRDEIDKDTAEAQIIAERILELKKSFTVNEKGVTRPFRYGDCCILLRSHKTHAAAYRDTLLAYGIPAVASASSGFFEAAEIRLALSLLRCIDNPLQDIPLTAIMLSPLFGFTTDDMAAIRLCRPKTALYNAVTAAARQGEDALSKRCRAFLDTLRRYRELAALLTVDRLLTRLYEDLALPELLRARFGGDNRAENLRLLYEQCARFEQGGFRGLSAFIRHIDRLQELGVDLPGASVNNAENAVRIMSIHGSKGLEFPVVFLAGLGGEFNRENTKTDLLLHSKYGAGMNLRDPVSLARHVTLPRQGLVLMQQGDDRAEELRILYVAMTRAREKLYLVMSVKDPDRKLTALGASRDTNSDTLPACAVRDANSMSDWILSALLRHPCGEELCERAGIPPVPLPDDAVWHISFCAPRGLAPFVTETETPAVPDGALMDTIRAHMAYAYPYERLSRVPTKLAASEIAADPTRPDLVAHARPSFLTKQDLTPAERGAAMHGFMQFADFAAAAVSTENEAKRLAASGFLSAEQAASLDHKRLRAFFESDLYRRMCAAERVLREYSFTFREAAKAYDPAVTDPNEAVVIQGIADCVFVENGALVIVDYKTDRVRTPAELIERYRAQLDVYARALSTVLELPVRECLLYSFALGNVIKV